MKLAILTLTYEPSGEGGATAQEQPREITITSDGVGFPSATPWPREVLDAAHALRLFKALRDRKEPPVGS